MYTCINSHTCNSNADTLQSVTQHICSCWSAQCKARLVPSGRSWWCLTVHHILYNLITVCMNLTPKVLTSCSSPPQGGRIPPWVGLEQPTPDVSTSCSSLPQGGGLYIEQLVETLGVKFIQTVIKSYRRRTTYAVWLWLAQYNLSYLWQADGNILFDHSIMNNSSTPSKLTPCIQWSTKVQNPRRIWQYMHHVEPLLSTF